MQGALGQRGTAVDEELFRFLTELETRKALRLQYPVSVVAIVPERNGHDATGRRGLSEQLIEVLRPLLRGTDVVTMASGTAAVQLLLVDASLESLPLVVSRLADEVSQHTFDVNGDKSAKFKVGVGSFPGTAINSGELLMQASARAEGALDDKGLHYELQIPARPTA